MRGCLVGKIGHGCVLFPCFYAHVGVSPWKVILNKKVYTLASCGFFLLLWKRANAQIDEHICQIICDVMNTKLVADVYVDGISSFSVLFSNMVVALDFFQQVRETKIFLKIFLNFFKYKQKIFLGLIN